MNYSVKTDANGHKVLLTEFIQAVGSDHYHIRPATDAAVVEMGDGTTLLERFVNLERAVAGSGEKRSTIFTGSLGVMPSDLKDDGMIWLITGERTAGEPVCHCCGRPQSSCTCTC